ncbi:MAG: RNA polymerase sigma factor [Planctomycetaceae bacterium]
MTTGPSDERLQRLVAEAQAGDRDSFEALIAEVYPRLKYMASCLACGDQIAEDVVQETGMVLLDKLAGYHPTHPFENWLRGVVRNKLLELLRKKRRFPGTLPPFGESDDGSVVSNAPADRHGQTPEQAALRKEIIERVRRCVKRLPAKLCQAIEAYELDNDAGLTIKEVADRLGVPINTFRSHLAGARRLLAECLAREDL